MLATHLSTAASLAGHSVILIDTDPQCSATGWWDKRHPSNEKPSVIAAPTPRLNYWLEIAKANGATFAFIDTEANIRSPALEAARAASFVLVPSRAADVDVSTIPATMDVIKQAQKPSRVVFNAVKPGSTIGTEAQRQAKGLGLACVPFEVGDRVGFVRAFNAGQTVLETEPDSKSAREIQRLYNFLEREVSDE